MAFLKIVGLCVLAACIYGILHDQVTARVCVEYFTIGHPRIIRSESPTLLGLVWGVVATWWFGAILGVVLGVAARAGRPPRLTAREIFSPLLVSLAVLGCAAFVVGLIGHGLATSGKVQLVGRLAERVPSDRHVAFLAVGFAHAASYLGGVAVCVVLIVRVLVRRRSLRRATGGSG